MYLFIFAFFTLNPKAKIFIGIPCKSGLLCTFTNEPSSNVPVSQCLQRKTSPFHSTLLCSLSLSNFISQFVAVNFLGHYNFLGFCYCWSFGVCLISMPLCLTLICLNWVPRFCKVSFFFVFGYFAMTPMHVCMNVKLKRLKIIYRVLAFSLLNLLWKKKQRPIYRYCNYSIKKKVKRNYKLQREARNFLILIENKEGIRDFIAGILELVMVIVERRSIGRIWEIDKWKKASTSRA